MSGPPSPAQPEGGAPALIDFGDPGAAAPLNDEFGSNDANRLNSTIESLKPTPQTNDKNTVFWTAYKSLADEFDKEFLRKYGNDLDTSLIFAGLFSAVSSAFIIQIQPELQSSTTGPPAIIVVAQAFLYFSLFSTLGAALLTVLGKQWLLHYDSVGEKGTIEERGLERQRKFDGLRSWKFDVVMQMFPLLIQFSLLLFALALSIYLWTIHRAIAGIVIGWLALGSLLYFSMVISALRSPDSPFQTSLTFLITALIRKTTLSPSFHRILKSISRQAERLRRSLQQTWSSLSSFPPELAPILPIFGIASSALAPPSPAAPIFNIWEPSKQIPAVLWALETSTDPIMADAVAAIILETDRWPIELDLAPSMRRMMYLIKGCLWGDSTLIFIPLSMEDRAISYIKAFGVLGLVSGWREDFPVPWNFAGADVANANIELRSLVRFFTSSRFPQNVQSLTFLGSPPPFVITQWTLRFLSAQRLSEDNLVLVLEYFNPGGDSQEDISLLADFLFCMNTFFCPATAQDLSVMDKSAYCNLLTALLFENMTKNRQIVKPLREDTIYAIINKIKTFGSWLEFPYHPGHDRRGRIAIYGFCSLPKLPWHTRRAALEIVRRPLEVVCVSREDPEDSPDTTWVYDGLQNAYESRTGDDAAEIGADLLAVVVPYGPHITKPNIAALHAILWAVSLDVDYSDASDIHLRRLKSFAFTLLTSAVHWFYDDDLRPVLQEHNVWAKLGTFTTENPASGGFYTPDDGLPPSPPFVQRSLVRYYALGTELSNDSTWKTIISENLPGWLAHTWMMKSPDLREAPEFATARGQFRDGLFHIWDADAEEGDEFGPEKSLVMAVTALAKFWGHVESLKLPRFDRLIHLIESSISTAFCTRILGDKLNHPSQQFLDVVVLRLGRAVTDVVERNQHADEPGFNLPNELPVKVAAVTDFLKNLAETILGELRSGWPNQMRRGIGNEEEMVSENEEESEVKYWTQLRDKLYDELNRLR
ncbi:hypothetical protein C8R43DRAFT_960117 [Mycena crocata]|nr:hypothetical protein C8R43DRAFT_960117 [Mycena crocata]